MENRDDKLKICSFCEHRTQDWKCSLNKENLFSFTENLNNNCPQGKWDKGVFPLETLEPSILDEIGAVKIEKMSREALSAQFKKKKLELKPHKNLISPKSTVADIIYCIKNYPAGGWITDIHKWPNVQQAYRELSVENGKKISLMEYPKDRFKGRGIVVVGGGQKYFPSLYVNLRMLRLLGCTLPVEVYYIGVKEMDYKMIAILEAIDNVKCIDAVTLESKYPIRIHGGWESKVYSIMNSSFEEVLMLDADNTPLINPEFLFEEEEYKKFGAVLWPDYSCWVHDKNLWSILGIKYIDELQIESGQILINKSECWREINMAKYYCDYSDYYFKLFYGDKEAFHFGWRFLGSDYARPPGPDWINNSIIVQRDFNGAWLFSHRAQAKFSLEKKHKIAWEMPYEQDTLDLLEELGSLWCGGVWMNKNPTEEELNLIEKVQNHTYDYVRVGIDKRELELLPNHQIGRGADRLERHWHLFLRGKEIIISIHGDNGLTALFKYDNNKWVGKWLDYERCDVELILK